MYVGVHVKYRRKHKKKCFQYSRLETHVVQCINKNAQKKEQNVRKDAA
jgi:hypothetical protein